MVADDSFPSPIASFAPFPLAPNQLDPVSWELHPPDDENDPYFEPFYPDGSSVSFSDFDNCLSFDPEANQWTFEMSGPPVFNFDVTPDFVARLITLPTTWDRSVPHYFGLPPLSTDVCELLSRLRSFSVMDKPT